MKTLLFSFLFSTLLLIGCADKPTSPIESNNHSYQLIKLPPKAGLSVENMISVDKTISGEHGGTIKIKESYVAQDGHTVKIDVKLEIKKNSFSGDDVNITMNVDDDFAAVWFSPHMIFNKPVELTVKFEGIGLNEIESVIGEYDFIYINDTGIFEDVDHNGVIVQENNGTIRVNKAYLNHFSRYAFTR
jgi:hypothetical protein